MDRWLKMPAFLTPAGALAPALLAVLALGLTAGGPAACGGSTGGAGAVGAAQSRTAAPGAAAGSDALPGEVAAGAVYRDLAYGRQSPAQRLDLYLPAAGRPPYPLLVGIHGGGFMSGDKEDGQIVPVLQGLSRGYAVAGLDYRLSQEAPFPAAVSDVKAAVRWLRAHAGEYGLDGSRVALWGDSAGGNLAALAGASGDSAALRGPHPTDAGQSDAVQAVVDWFGPISFLRTDDDFRAAGVRHPSEEGAGSFLSRYLGAPLAQVPGRVRAADPITYLTPGDPPILVEHGTQDHTVPWPQSQRLAQAWAAATGGGGVTLHLIPGAGHMDRRFFTRAHIERVLDWLDAHLR